MNRCQQQSHLKGAHERLIHAHHGSSVVKLSAVVWRREQSDELPLGEKFVAVLDHLQRGSERVNMTGHTSSDNACRSDHLVGATDQVQVMFV